MCSLFFKTVRPTFLLLLLLLLGPVQLLAGENVFGFTSGFTYQVKEAKFLIDSSYPPLERFYTMRPTGIPFGLSYRFFPNDGRWGIGLEYMRQRCDSLYHSQYGGKESVKSPSVTENAFSILAVILEYRFRKSPAARLTPSIDAGLCHLSTRISQGFFTTTPYVPSRWDVKLGAGVLFKLNKNLRLNAAASFYAANSLGVLRAGVEIAF